MRILRLLSSFAFLASLASCLAPNGDFGSWTPNYSNYNDAGSGTTQDPFQIYTAAQMQSLAANSQAWSANYVLMNDIDMDGAVLSQPIGNSAIPFTGTFNSSYGQVYTISNLKIVSYLTEGAGVFGQLSGTVADVSFSKLSISAAPSTDVGAIGFNTGTVSDVQVFASSVLGGTNVGAVVGGNQGTVVLDASDQTVVQGSSSVGGLVGSSDVSGSVSRSATGTADTVIGQSEVGGLVGSESGSSVIENSYSLATVKTPLNGAATMSGIGGLVGFINEGSSVATAVRNSYSSAMVSVPIGVTATDIGGLVGDLSIGSLDWTFAANAISAGSGASAVGGLIGTNSSAGSITNSFAAEISISGGTPLDPLVGSNANGSLSVATLSYSSLMTCNSSVCPSSSIGGSSPQIPTNYYTSSTFPGGSTFTAPLWSFSGKSFPVLPDPPQFPLKLN